MEGESGPSSGRYASEEHHVTRERAALAEMAYRLSSSNVVGEHEDDGSTRREAKLLMSLSAFPESPNQSDLDLISSSESDSSYMSDSSRSYENFSFVCPSLSLEHITGSALQHAYRKRQNLALKADTLVHKKSENSPTPAKLLGRPLKADDRDAVRLSADAMARNVHDSFRKAVQWRINAWIETLSKSIASQERAMVAIGAKKEELKCLLSSSEAKLILKLRSIEDEIKVTGTRTSFTILPQRVDKKEGEPAPKKQRTVPCPQLEEGEYQYSVAHAMRFECSIELETPAGFSEVSLEVPGAMDGTFLSFYDREEMTAVSLDINTEMLAAMVEKCCRKIVRVSLEALLKEQPVPPKPEPLEASHKAVSFAQSPKPKTSRALISEFATPPPATTTTVSPEEVRAALVSPPNNNSSTNYPPPSTFLSPIPDDFESFAPRRISPQPRSANFKETFSSLATPQTPKIPISGGHKSVMVSPSPQNVECVKSKKKGPSLPMLVEVACRAYRDN